MVSKDTHSLPVYFNRWSKQDFSYDLTTNFQSLNFNYSGHINLYLPGFRSGNEDYTSGSIRRKQTNIDVYNFKLLHVRF